MADAGHFFSGDLQLGATGDLLVADGVLESQQRILRRLLTNPRDYIWQPGYGAGLPGKIGLPLDEAELDTLIRSQMYLEESVVQNPAPQVITTAIPNGIDVQIQYVEADSAQTATLSFDVTPDMALQTYIFSQLVNNIATAVQGSASALIDFTVGSVLRAIAEATASVVLWLQAIILQVLTLTRAATSNGSDLDTWCADFGLARLPATAATGQVTFARFTATQQALVPVGATTQTSDGTQTYAVTADPTNSAYSATLGGYVILPNTASVNVPVQATSAGVAGNVQPGTITVITTPIPGVDTVTNAAAFTNGIDPESDAAFRVRFVAYLGSLSKATKAAVAYAVTTVQQGLDYTITENYAYNGTYQPGYFYVVVDDGTGSPPGSLVTNVADAIEAVRGLTITFGVFPPLATTANVGMTLTTASGFNRPSVVAAVTQALTDFINGLPLGTSLPYTQLAGIAYAVPGVVNATGITLNSGTADLAADARHKILAGTVAVA